MKKYASKMVKQAQSWIGLNERDGSHKKVIDTYNSHKPLARGVKMQYDWPWCATFVSAVAIKLGYTDIIPTECSCSRMIKLHKELGIFIENENRIPNPGDILFYDWEDNGVGDNVGDPDHVGLVECVSGNMITIIEGNYSKSVKRRKIAVNGKLIRGYSVPKYDIETNEPSKPEVKPAETVVKSKIDTVKEVQSWLNETYKSGLVVDGVYGPLTKAALVKVLQKAIGVAADGIYGTKTNRAVKVLRKGSTGESVRALQGLLVCSGYTGAYVDGDFGSGTEKAVKEYQSKKKLAVDGLAGKDTFSALCK